jgi:hypothetical protein
MQWIGKSNVNLYAIICNYTHSINVDLSYGCVLKFTVKTFITISYESYSRIYLSIHMLQKNHKVISHELYLSVWLEAALIAENSETIWQNLLFDQSDQEQLRLKCEWWWTRRKSLINRLIAENNAYDIDNNCSFHHILLFSYFNQF